MELKGYQQEVLQDLEDYIAAVEVAGGDLPKAYESYWDARGVRVGHGSDMHAYSDRATPGVPRVTLKVPTAGGKTLIACCALGPLVEAAQRAGGERVVAWFVPSDAILQQTYARLSDPRHPYRVMLERAAGRRVRVVNKEDALFGEGITPPEVEGQLTVFVLSVQSFATNNAEGRRVYRENGNLLSWVKYYTAETPRVEESDETGLIQVLAHLRPVVVIDESHNFHAELREEVMRQLHPRFILNLTATPRQESNIISSVDALRLKEAEMVKLPVVVYNFSQEEEVVQAAVAYQRSLERRAREAERERGAEYVRPIVLLQAQPRRGEETLTYDKIKEQLLGYGVGRDEVRVKTADLDELQGVDLMSRGCEVRFVITVNALREGWDCPFAYVLATVANRSSRIEVEQILGRVLRQPYVQRHPDELLNMSYVFSSSADFSATLDSVIAGLEGAGFTDRDYCVGEDTTQPAKAQQLRLDLKDDSQGCAHEERGRADGVSAGYLGAYPTEGGDDAPASSVEEPTAEMISRIEQTAIREQQQYGEQMAKAQQGGPLSMLRVPVEVKSRMREYAVVERFRERMRSERLPQLAYSYKTQYFNELREQIDHLSPECLSTGLDLSTADLHVNFARRETNARSVDLERIGAGQSRVVNRQVSSGVLQRMREYFYRFSGEARLREMMKSVVLDMDFPSIADSQLNEYVGRVLNSLSEDARETLLDDWTGTQRAFREKVMQLLEAHRQLQFEAWETTGRISSVEDYELPTAIMPRQPIAGLQKALYEMEGDMNALERSVIERVAELDSVECWHRNGERGKGFVINGFINHYPDFLLWLTNGDVVALETKGDDRDNADSRKKIYLGKKWAEVASRQAKRRYHYMMVFDTARLNGAFTVAEALARLGEMGGQHTERGGR